MLPDEARLTDEMLTQKSDMQFYTKCNAENINKHRQYIYIYICVYICIYIMYGLLNFIV